MFWVQSQSRLVQFPIARQKHGQAEKIDGHAEKIEGCEETTHVATLYGLKIFHLHLFLKGKVEFCGHIFPQKKYLLSVEN